MRIRNVVITNYRNFESFNIDLKEFTLIIGENNIGKTNFITALGLIFSHDISFYKKRKLELDDLNIKAVNQFKEDVLNINIPISDIRYVDVKVEVYLTDFLGNPKQEAVVADWLIDETLSVAKLTFHFALKEDLTDWINDIRETGIKNIDFPIRKYDYIVFGGLDNSKSVDYYFLKMLKFEFLDALRDAKTQLIASGDYRLLYKVLTNLGEGQFENVKLVLKDLKVAVDNNPALLELKSKISTFLDRTSLVNDDDSNDVDFEFSKIEENEILKKLSLVYGTAPLTIDRNGLGRNNILYMSLVLSHLISRIDSSNCFRIIAIEEPEAHLHPNLQEHFAKNIQSLTNGNLQIIITSHSTHITSKLNLENTVVIFNDYQKKQVSSHYILNNFGNLKGKLTAEAKHSIRYLSRFLDSTKSTMFFSRKLILVEGIAEQTLIPILFERIYQRSIEKEGITIVNVNGVAFEHFLKILKNGYFIKCLVLTDSDSGTKQSNRAAELKEEFKEFSSIIEIQVSATSTFEKDLIEHNKNDTGTMTTLLEAISLTRPQSGGKGFAAAFSKSKDTESFFNLIETKDKNGIKTGDYKSEFATDLESLLSQVIFPTMGAESEVVVASAKAAEPTKTIAKPEVKPMEKVVPSLFDEDSTSTVEVVPTANEVSTEEKINYKYNFNVPKYIADGFSFLTKKGSDEN